MVKFLSTDKHCNSLSLYRRTMHFNESEFVVNATCPKVEMSNFLKRQMWQIAVGTKPNSSITAKWFIVDDGSIT